MKILMLFSFPPLPAPRDLGGTKRNLPFLLENAKRHEVSVLSFGTAEEEQYFRERIGHLFREIRFVDRRRSRIMNGIEKIWLLLRGKSSFRQLYRPAMQNAIDEMTAGTAYDVIHCVVPMFGYFRFPKQVPVVSDTHEVTYDLYYRMYKNMSHPFWKALNYMMYRMGKPEELDLCRSFDALVTTTERDFAVFRKELPGLPMYVVQNGAGESFFEPVNVTPEPNTMVFTGLMTYYPNDQGMLWFLDEIFPKILAQVPDARVCVVGKDPSKEILARASERVVVTGFVDDVRPYMGRAQVYIIPLQVGGGIRGKALEAMAMRRPIVTTSIGVEGIHLSHETSALFGDTAEDFASAVLRLFHDESVRHQITENAYRTAVERYKWEAKGRELERVYEAAIRSRNNNQADQSRRATPAPDTQPSLSTNITS